jgi:prophage regulatory protein
MDRYLDRHQLRYLVPFTTQHLNRLEKKGLFPQRRQLGPNRVAWLESEVLAWCESRPRGGPPQKADLGPKRAAPEPDPEAMRRLHALLAEQAELLARLGLEGVPAAKKPERQRRSRSGP